MAHGRGGVGAALVAAAAVLVGACGSGATRPPLSLAGPLAAAIGSPPAVTTTTTTTPPPTAPPAAASTLPPMPPASPLAAALAGANDCAVAVRGSAVLASVNPDLPLAPASTQKLLTAAAALTRLGPDFRFVTKVVAAAEPVNGAVDDLWLVGAGDPVMATPEYAAWMAKQAELAGAPITPLDGLAASLAAAGVRSVAHGIHGDDSHFDRLRYLPTWPAIDRTEGDIGPLGALSVNNGFTSWTPTLVAAPDPATYTSSELARLLTARGVSVAGAADQDAPPGAVVLAQIASPPLSQLIASMLRVSDNYTAELLTREIDRSAGGSGVSADGAHVIVATMQSLGLPTAGVSLLDGSGLSPGARSTCRMELAALQLGDRPGLDAMHSGLAVAGVSGTLIHRFIGTPFQGHLLAKTGWITGAAGMVGDLQVGAPLQFAFIANAPFAWPAAEARENSVVAALASLPTSGS